MARITARLEKGFAVKVSNGRHVWHADEPADAGGTDSGPNPYELLLGSLAACTCMTLSKYCSYKKLPLRSVSASYNFDRIHSKDCEDCDKPDRGFIDRITSQIEIEGDFDEAQRKRLTEVAERCPVHKTLEHGIHFDDNVTF